METKLWQTTFMYNYK